MLKERLAVQTRSRRHWLVVAGVAITWLLFGVAAHIPVSAQLAMLLLSILFSATGVCVFTRAVDSNSTPLPRLVFGSILGLLLGRLALAGLGLLGGGLGLVQVWICVAMCAVVVSAFWRPPVAERWPSEDKTDAMWTFACVAVVLLAMSGPLASVGRETRLGHAFVPYFCLDFMNHSAIAAELTRSMPPQNPWFAGTVLHYYWLSHLWPAAILALVGGKAIHALSATLPINVFLFVAALNLVSRRYVRSPVARFAGIAVGCLAFSYVGYVFWAIRAFPVFARAALGSAVEDYSWLSHSWFRDFLYEPHAIFALSVLLLITYEHQPQRSRVTIIGRAVLGIALGAILITDALIGFVAFGWFVSVNAFQYRSNRKRDLSWVVSIAAAGGVIGLAYAIQLLPRGGQPVTLWPQPLLWIAPFYLTLEFGPVFVLGVAGIAVALLHRRRRWSDPLLLLLAVSIVAAFTVHVTLDPPLGLRKALKVAQIPLVVFAGLWFAEALTSPRKLRVTIIVAGLGFASLASDLYSYMGVTTADPKSTIYLTADEMRAYEWVRTQTPRDAVLQIFGLLRPGRQYRSSTLTVMQGITERRTLFGNYYHPWVFQVDDTKLEQRRLLIERLSVAELAEAVTILAQLPPHLMIVNEKDSRNAGTLHELQARSCLATVHRSGSVVIYQTGGTRGCAQAPVPHPS